MPGLVCVCVLSLVYMRIASSYTTLALLSSMSLMLDALHSGGVGTSKYY